MKNLFVFLGMMALSIGMGMFGFSSGMIAWVSVNLITTGYVEIGIASLLVVIPALTIAYWCYCCLKDLKEILI